MSDVRIGLVAEGKTDLVVIEAALQSILGDRSFVLKLLQPETSAPFGGAGQHGGGFIEGFVYGRMAATQVVVIHGGQIIMDQRVGVNALDGRCRTIQILFSHPQHAAGGVDQKGTNPLAAEQQAMAHGRLQARRHLGEAIHMGGE